VQQKEFEIEINFSRPSCQPKNTCPSNRPLNKASKKAAAARFMANTCVSMRSDNVAEKRNIKLCICFVASNLWALAKIIAIDLEAKKKRIAKSPGVIGCP